MSSELAPRLRPWSWASLAQAGGEASPPAPTPAEVLAAARVEAEAIVAAARAEAAAEMARLREEARALGAAEGAAQGAAAAAALRATAVDILARARAERRRILAGLTHDVARLALAVAGRVLEQDLSGQADAVVALTRRLSRRMNGPATVRVHPNLAPLLEAEMAGSSHVLRVLPDAAVDPGGVVLEGEDGVIDARLAERLRRVAATIDGGGRHA